MPNFDEFVAKMESRLVEAGAETVLEAARSQYKEWKASK